LKRPSLGAVLIGLVPFAGACFSVSLWDRIDPRILGIPFNMFWLMSWLVLTPLCMWGAYTLEVRQGNTGESNSDHKDRAR
jgi:hypothetical protein